MRFTKPEKIYKFIYRVPSMMSYEDDRVTLLTARDPVSAVRLFNHKCKNGLVNIKEFIEVKPKENSDGK